MYVVIIGGAESGVGAAILAQKQGHLAFVSDAAAIGEVYKNKLISHHISFEEHGHSWDKIQDAQLVIKSPGVPEKTPIIQQIRTAGIPLISEVEWAYRYAAKSTIVAITGSNGKSTTTALTAHLLQNEDTAMVGNIGISFAETVAISPKKRYVAEVSSFQLDDILFFKPKVSILLNITPDHLDRYDYQVSKYAKAKFNIILNQDNNDYFIYNVDSPILMENLPLYINRVSPVTITLQSTFASQNGACVQDNHLCFRWQEQFYQISIADVPLPGKHNQYNVMAALLAGLCVGEDWNSMLQKLPYFKSIPHRLEKVRVYKGITFINDSKATNIDSTWYALDSTNTPIIWIAGGIDKGNDYSLLKSVVHQKVKAIICMTKYPEKIEQAFHNLNIPIIVTDTAQKAVEKSLDFATEGDTVLLSPACASFDLFKNYEDRGDQFKKVVLSLGE
ncbi:MAG: UDP-N-acetylmuramoyl-L-alanine--D-glutamate ligase [Bacteroidia bacterium]|nr:UDP-N-acetylmuramoyl-L-alanine--D-glutamate ligase [Bacteroidia bacterium]MDW8345948.1 UDP-N-acetylmuramoyl-L-alanine--D-glutamate ligase [Bacteroidia bacterium]